ncbi:MAG: hypothetical protein ACTSYT_02520, partial [Candidatus Asgardarchaeia archaeon]
NTRADPAQGVFRHEGIYLTAIKLPLGGGWIAEVSVNRRSTSSKTPIFKYIVEFNLAKISLDLGTSR